MGFHGFSVGKASWGALGARFADDQKLRQDIVNAGALNVAKQAWRDCTDRRGICIKSNENMVKRW